MNKINYQKELDKIIDSLNGRVPTLLLHSCCAPCSSYTLEYLSNYFDITVYYYNPNISPKTEFDKRFGEQKRLIASLPAKHEIKLVEGDYNYIDFSEIAKGFEDAIVTVNDSYVDVTLIQDEITDTEKAQIEDAVTRKTGYDIDKVVISFANSK